MSIRAGRARFPLAAALMWLLLVCPSQGRELVVKQDQTPLTSACLPTDAPLARLQKGQTVRLRFALAGSDSRCYSVSAEVDGQTVNGYVAKGALEGLEQFEQTRRKASASRLVDSAIRTLGMSSSQPVNSSTRVRSDSPETQAALLRAAAELTAGKPAEAERLLVAARLPASHPEAALLRAKSLLQLMRPREALAAIEPALRSHPNDVRLLALAGLSCYQQDQARAAQQYLRRSLEIQPNPLVEKVYRAVQRELQQDKSHEKTYGSRFVLRYEGEALPPEAARRLTAAFERELTRISYQLGCHLDERLVVIVQSRENYRNTTGAAEWSGGRYDGRIRIAVPPGGQVDDHVRRSFSHEFVHACLARTGRWPAWLHECLAQKLAGDQVLPRDREILRRLARAERLPKLSRLGNNWARLNTAEAAVAYSLALAATEIFFQDYREYGVRNLLNNPGQLPQITAHLERRLRKVFR